MTVFNRVLVLCTTNKNNANIKIHEAQSISESVFKFKQMLVLEIA